MKLFIQQVLHLLENDKKKLPLMIIIFLMSSSLDLLGIGIIGPYIALLSDVDIYKGGFKNLITFIGFPEDKKNLLIWLGYSLILIFLVKAIFSVWINKIIVTFGERQHIRLISFLMKSYQSLSYIDYIKRNSSEYIYSIHHLTNQYANQVVAPLLRMVSDGIVTIVIIIFLVLYSPLALALLVGFIGVLLLIYDTLFRKKMNNYGKESNIASASILQSVNEGINGLKEIRILGKEKYFHKNVEKYSDMLAFFSIKALIVSTSLRYFLELTMASFVVTLVIVTLTFKGNLELLLPTLSVFGVASLRLFPAANSFMHTVMQMRYGKDAVSRLFNDITIINESQKMKNSQLVSKNNKIKFENLILKNVSFTYPNTKIKALNKISLEINVGESIGIIGSSGSGKTTLLDTLLGLFEPQKGSIEFNGKDIRNNLQQWQSQVAYLPQEIFLIDGTLRQNITLGISKDDIDESKLNESIRQARLNYLLNELPQGLDTTLGERGIRFSGGQKQRVALARAFYHSRDILVMDEATSALDDKTEGEIVAEIERLKGRKTMIVIAHRLTTLQHCDRIYQLKKGKIVKVGSYNQIVLRNKI